MIFNNAGVRIEVAMITITATDICSNERIPNPAAIEAVIKDTSPRGIIPTPIFNELTLLKPDNHPPK